MFVFGVGECGYVDGGEIVYWLDVFFVDCDVDEYCCYGFGYWLWGEVMLVCVIVLIVFDENCVVLCN